MKTLLLLSTFVTSTVFSQTVNGLRLNEIEAEYVRMDVDAFSFKRGVHIMLDYGQEGGRVSGKNFDLLDPAGKEMRFISEMDALNYLSKNGFELVQAYIQNLARREPSYYYMLRRKKKE